MSISRARQPHPWVRGPRGVFGPLLALLLLLSAGGNAQPAAAAANPPAKVPATPQKPVTDVVQGVPISDSYRWLEAVADPSVQEWARAQTAVTRSTLDALPHHGDIAARVAALARGASPTYYALEERGGRWFALKSDKTKNQPLLVLLQSPDHPGHERVLLDPNVLDTSGATAIDFFRPSKDGRLLAVSLSRKGTEAGDVHVYQVESGKELTLDVVPRVNGGTAGGDVAWAADGPGFFYTRYPRGTERPAADLDFFQQVWFHRLGTPGDKDSYEIGRDFPRIAETTLEMSPDGRLLLASVKNGDGGDVMHFLRGMGGTWTPLAVYADRIREARFGLDGALYLLSLKDAERGKILRLGPGLTVLDKAVLVAPEGQGAVSDFLATRHRLYVAALVGGPSQVRVFDTAGKALGMLPTPPVSSVGALTHAARGDDVYFLSVQYTQPPAWFRYDAGQNAVQPTPLAVHLPGRLEWPGSHPRGGHVRRRDEGAAHHRPRQGHPARTGRPPASSTATAATASASTRPSSAAARLARAGRRLGGRQHRAAAANSAKPGTGRATSPRSKMSSTTSWPARGA